MMNGNNSIIKRCKSKADFHQLLSESTQKPVFLLKHSSACSLSAMAWNQFSQIAEDHAGAEYWIVSVIESRSLSLEIADLTGIRHESPQVILFYNKEPVWNKSHLAIRQKKLAKALEKVKAKMD